MIKKGRKTYIYVPTGTGTAPLKNNSINDDADGFQTAGQCENDCREPWIIVVEKTMHGYGANHGATRVETVLVL